MFTDARQARRSIAILATALLMPFAAAAQTAIPAPAASPVVDDGTWRSDLALDLAFGVLERPVLQPISVPGAARRGLPDWPIYKQEPLGARYDLRPSTSAPNTPTPGPTPPSAGATPDVTPAPDVAGTGSASPPPTDIAPDSGGSGTDYFPIYLPGIDFYPIEGIVIPPDDGGIEQNPGG